MAHGRHRRATIRKIQLPFLMETPAPAQQPAPALLVEQQHMVHDGDDVEQVFNLMACVHPSTCTCETDYPNWAPGLR